jgi:putative phosphoribosyl transferase
MIHLPFSDRVEAGRLLGAELAKHKLPPNVVVLALPRGGVPVGLEVAKALHAPLDVVVVRKVGVPWQPELAMGAIAGGSVEVLNEELIADLRVSRQEVNAAVVKERAEVERREQLYRSGQPAPDLRGRAVLVVDDGLATGSTMLVAARYVRSFKPAKMIIAVPVGSSEACRRLKKEADEFVCLATPEFFMAVGEWFEDFRQVTDAEVRRLLEESRQQIEVAKALELPPKRVAPAGG